jgi:hypothetical protein
MNRFGATHLAVKALFLRAEIDITFVPTNSYRSISSCSAKRVAHVAEKNSVLCDLRDETVMMVLLNHWSSYTPLGKVNSD